MDKINDYQEKITKLLTQHLQHKPSYGNVEVQPIFDTEHHRYQIISIGWKESIRIYYPMMQLDIKNDKIWIQENTTEVDIALELMEMGVPKHDIVIGFHSPKMRELSGFAIG